MLPHTALLSYVHAGARGLTARDCQLPNLGTHVGLRQGHLESQSLVDLSSACGLGFGSGLQMPWGWVWGGLPWSGGLWPGPWYVAGWPLRLGWGHDTASLTPLIPTPWVSWVVAAYRGPIQELRLGFQGGGGGGGAGLLLPANETFSQFLPFASR